MVRELVPGARRARETFARRRVSEIGADREERQREMARVGEARQPLEREVVDEPGAGRRWRAEAMDLEVVRDLVEIDADGPAPSSIIAAQPLTPKR